MPKLDAAIMILCDAIDDHGVIGVPEVCDSCRLALKILLRERAREKRKADPKIERRTK